MARSVPRIMATPLVKVVSSAFSHIGYNPKTRNLKVVFKETEKQPPSVYGYQNVSQQTYEKLLNSSSIGRFYNSNIKGKYPPLNLL